MNPPRAPGRPRELPELALALALLATLLAFGAATLSPGVGRAPGCPDPCREAELPRAYSWPVAPIAFASLLDSA